MRRDSWQAWLQASRPPFYIATLVPLTAGFVLAGRESIWRPWLFLVINLGAFMVHLATNLANDCFDHLQGADEGSATGGSRVIQEGRITLRSLVIATITLFGLAFLIAVWLTASQSVWGLWSLILLAFFSSLFYVAPPIRYGWRGFGEVGAGLNMGPVMVVGTYWVLTGHPAWSAFWLSLPIGLMVATILYFQNLPDLASDTAVGKRTLVVRLGNPLAGRILPLFGLAIYGSITALYFTGQLGWLSLLAWLTLPVFYRMWKKVQLSEDWRLLDAKGYMIRRIYLFNGLLLIMGTYWS